MRARKMITPQPHIIRETLVEVVYQAIRAVPPTAGGNTDLRGIAGAAVTAMGEFYLTNTVAGRRIENG
jgi:hypothetical protein